MGEPKTAADWKAARGAQAEMDGDAWDAEDERLDDLWVAQYRSEFVVFATTRPGWTQANAQDWADGIGTDAMDSARGDDRSPGEVARADVLEAEMEQ